MSSLEEVVAAFGTWRETRKSRSVSIPDSLWDLVRALVPYYKKVTIQRALHLSGKQFNKHCSSEASVQRSTLVEDQFAQGTLQAAVGTTPTALCEMKLQGSQHTLAITVPVAQAGILLSSMVAYL